MNYDNPIASLFPGTSGRVVAALVRLHAEGVRTVETQVIAARASVVPEQLRKVATRLALLGLLAFPIDEQITLVREHVMWDALSQVDDPQPRIDALVADVIDEQSTAAGGRNAETIIAAGLGGPVAVGTASAFPDELHLALVVRDPATCDLPLAALAERISRATGNACRVDLVAVDDRATLTSTHRIVSQRSEPTPSDLDLLPDHSRSATP